MHKVGDFVRIIEDPMSFIVGDDIDGLTGMIINIDQQVEIYTVLLNGGTRTVRVLDFMLQKIESGKYERKNNRGRPSQKGKVPE